MLESPDAVLVYIPLMKGLGMSWEDIKRTPKMELEVLLQAMHEYDELHSMDGYDDKDINEMAKNKPSIRMHYARYLEKRAKYNDMIGKKREVSFEGLKQ